MKTIHIKKLFLTLFMVINICMPTITSTYHAKELINTMLSIAQYAARRPIVASVVPSTLKISEPTTCNPLVMYAVGALLIGGSFYASSHYRQARLREKARLAQEQDMHETKHIQQDQEKAEIARKKYELDEQERLILKKLELAKQAVIQEQTEQAEAKKRALEIQKQYEQLPDDQKKKDDLELIERGIRCFREEAEQEYNGVDQFYADREIARLERKNNDFDGIDSEEDEAGAPPE